MFEKEKDKTEVDQAKLEADILAKSPDETALLFLPKKNSIAVSETKCPSDTKPGTSKKRKRRKRAQVKVKLNTNFSPRNLKEVLDEAIRIDKIDIEKKLESEIIHKNGSQLYSSGLNLR